MDKETSAHVSTIASEILNTEALDGETPADQEFNDLLAKAKTLAGSALAQDETPGQGVNEPEPSNYLERLERERAELAARFGKLQLFIDAGMPGVDDDQQRDLLAKQLPAMEAYLNILDERLAPFGDR